MTIQINTDKTIDGNEKYQDHFKEMLSQALKRFDSHITRLEVHLSDENGQKAGQNDIRCVIEARPEGRQPIAVTNQAATSEQAISGAITKLKASLDTILGRAANH